MNEPIAAIKPPEVKPWVRRAVEEVVMHALRGPSGGVAQDKRPVARNLTCHKLRAPMAHRTASIAIRIINGLPCA
jgi:hypothetical protein